MQLERDPKFARPGVALVVTGVAAILLRTVIDGVPWVGGLLGVASLLGGIVVIIGGIFLLIKRRER